MDVMRTLVDLFALMLNTSDGDVEVAANIEATAQGPVAAPQEPDATDHDFQMELEQYGEGDDALAY